MERSTVKTILYDLLKCTNEGMEFNWSQLQRDPWAIKVALENAISYCNIAAIFYGDDI